MNTPGTQDPTATPQGHQSFADVLHAEWTKLHTVRGWLIGLAVAALLIALFAFLTANGDHAGGTPLVIPTGPGGMAVADTYELVGHSLYGDGSLTARLTSLGGRISTLPANAGHSAANNPTANTRPYLDAWAKAGIIVAASARPGAPYAAVVVTGGHGVRFQYDYAHDVAGASSTPMPRWLRLVRSADTLTAYDSTDGRSWHEIGRTSLAGLPHAVQIGLFATSPATAAGLPTLAAATFDDVTLQATGAAGTWQAQDIGGNANYPMLAPGSSSLSGGSFALSGSGDIAPLVPVEGLPAMTPASSLPFGLIGGLIAAIVVATMFVTSEYRQGLIRTTFAAVPRRGRLLAAKALVIGAAAFVVGAVAAAIAVPIGVQVMRANGNYVFAVSTWTELRIVLSSGAVIALGAIGAVGLATLVRRSAVPITLGVAAFVVAYLLTFSLGASVTEWLYRVSPLAGLAVLQELPRYAQVSFSYSIANGYYPLAPRLGLAVLGAYTALVLALGAWRLKKSDA